MLSGTDFSPVLNSDDADIAACNLVNIISSVIDVNSSVSQALSRKRIFKPLIIPGILKCMRNRDKMYLKAKKENATKSLKITYIRYRNFCNNLRKKIKNRMKK